MKLTRRWVVRSSDNLPVTSAQLCQQHEFDAHHVEIHERLHISSKCVSWRVGELIITPWDNVTDYVFLTKVAAALKRWKDIKTQAGQG